MLSEEDICNKSSGSRPLLEENHIYIKVEQDEESEILPSVKCEVSDTEEDYIIGMETDPLHCDDQESKVHVKIEEDQDSVKKEIDTTWKSGTICSVYYCKNYSWQKDARSFFRFPKDRNRCAIWVNKCKRKDLDQMFKTYGSEYLYQSHRICSDHFQLSDFNNRNLKSQGLKKTAIPSLNLSAPSSKNVEPNIKKEPRRSPRKRTRLCIGEAAGSDRIAPMADINDFPLSEMVGCAAFGCSNRSEKGYLMKKFPRDPVRRKVWADKVRRKGWTPTHSSVLCEVHFEPSMWEKTRVDGTRRLKCDAVPTVFPFSPIKKRRKSPVKRASKLLTIPDDMVETSSNSSICTEAKKVVEAWPSEVSETLPFCTINIKMENSKDTRAFPAVQREEKVDAGKEDSAQGNGSEELYQQNEGYKVHIKVERDLEAVMSTPVKIEIKEECWGESELPRFFEENHVDVKLEEYQESEVLTSPSNVADRINHHIGGSAVQYSATSEDESGKTCSAEMLCENKRKKRQKIKVDSPEEQDHPYSCGISKKSFLNAGSLGRPKQMHVSKPPYSYICNFCK